MKKKKILIADDDPDILEVITLILQEKGYNVDTAPNGAKLEELESSLPDLLLLDISMSGVDGREVCKHLKNKQSTRHIPIVMISADIDIAKITAECGANDSLAKPFEIRELLAVIERHTADQQ